MYGESLLTAVHYHNARDVYSGKTEASLPPGFSFLAEYQISMSGNWMNADR